MKKLKEFLMTSLGMFGFLLYYLISLLITVYPLIMFDMKPWIYIVLALLVQFILVNIPFGIEALWVVGLFGAISGKQDIFALIYYVVFAIIAISVINNIVRAFKK